MSKNESLHPSFTYYLQGFLAEYAVGRLSPNTVAGYADAFRLLFVFFEIRIGSSPQKFGFDDFNRDFVLDFLRWLKDSRHCSDATINQRMYALHAFCRHMQYKRPEYLASFGAILSIPKRKYYPKAPRYLDETQTKVLLATPDPATPLGYRDMVMLCTLYEAALRVSELTSLNVGDIKFGHYPFIDVIGKGSKPRRVFISKKMEKILLEYFARMGYKATSMDDSLFKNQWGKRISRFGVGYILKKYYSFISGEGFPDSLSPHGLRHSRAMALKANDVDLLDIRDILGHSSTTTTELYARIDGRTRNEAIEKCSSILEVDEKPCWKEDDELKKYLKILGKVVLKNVELDGPNIMK